MKPETVFTEGWGPFKKKKEIQIPEESDIRQWIRGYLEPIHEELDTQSEELSAQEKEFQEFRSTTTEGIQKMQEELQTLRNEIAAAIQRMDTELQEFHEQIEKNGQKVAEIDHKLNVGLHGFMKGLSSELHETFTTGCRADIASYFQQLAVQVDEIKKEEAILQNTQKTIQEQFDTSLAIAGFFCDCFKADLTQKEESLTHNIFSRIFSNIRTEFTGRKVELEQESQRIARLNACLSHAENGVQGQK